MVTQWTALLAQVYEALLAGTVPVYRGARMITSYMPSADSFINANQMSAIRLAHELIRLADPRNRAEYEKFFRFKSRPLPQAFVAMANRSYAHPNMLCRLCEYAHNVRTGKSTDVT